VTENPKHAFIRLQIIGCMFFGAAAAVGLPTIAADAVDGSDRVEGQCEPILLLSQFFDGLVPPALPVGWSSTTWVTSDSGVPAPAADTLPNAAFVDDPATISDKQLFSPNISLLCDGKTVQVFFRNNFNFQGGFDGGVLEVSYDGGLTFDDVLAAGGTFVLGAYNGTISNCCGNPLAGRQAWTGNSNGFLDVTVVNLPGACGEIMLRWRMGSDSSVSAEGWRIDNVGLTQCFIPLPPRPRDRPTPRPRPTPR
jgi:hypothetical protein